MISESTIQQVKDAPIDDIVGRYVKLRRTGANLSGLCPFHNEKSPSFSVSPAKGFYKCFGCGKSGNGISFVMDKENLTFPEAVKTIAGWYSIFIEEDQPVDPQVKAQTDSAKDALIKAQQIYSTIPNSEKSLYWSGRGFTAASMKSWGIGIAPAYGDLSGIRHEDLIECGLLRKNEEGRPIWFFRNRLTLPIWNEQGEIVSFAGRSIDKQTPKYLNTRETKVYNKSSLLYGLNRAKTAIRNQGFAILTEGYLDVIRLHSMGADNAIATCGTALTDKHAKLLARYTNCVVIMRDGDKAGKKAALKDLSVLLHHIKEVLVFEIPDGHDPDSFFQDTANFDRAFLKDGWNDNIVQEAVFWFIDQQKAISPAQTSEAVNQLVELIRPLDKTQRDLYTKYAAKKWGVNTSSFRIAEKSLEEVTVEVGEEESLQAWVKEQVTQLYADGFVMNNDKQKDKIGAYYGNEGKKAVRLTNYTVKPLYFVIDGGQNRRLIEVYNGHKTSMLEMPNKAFISQDAFETEIISRGAYYSEPGFTKGHFKRMANWITDKLDYAYELKTLGFQPEGFFAYSNLALTADGSPMEYNEYGVVSVASKNFLFPGTGKLQEGVRQEDNKYINDLYLSYVKSSINFEKWAELFYSVYGKHGAFGISYIFFTIFKDIVSKVVKLPILYTYGAKGSGKSSFAESIVYLFFSGKDNNGQLIKSFNLNPGQGTPFSFFSRLSRFRNCPAHFNEYDVNNIEPWKKSAFKAYYDGEGREVGSMNNTSTSKRKTEQQQVESSVIISGQYLDTSDDGSILSRSIPLKFSETGNKNRTQEEKENYALLEKYQMEGLSSIPMEIFRHKKYVEQNFRDKFFEVKKQLSEYMRRSNYTIEDRILNNYSIMVSLTELMSSKIKLPYSTGKFFDLSVEYMKAQNSTLVDNNILGNFWTIIEILFDSNQVNHEGKHTHFIVAKTKAVKILTGVDQTTIMFEEPTEVLYIRLMNLYDAYARRYREQKNKPAPDYETIGTYLKDQPYHIGLVKAKQFADKSTSCIVLNYDMMKKLYGINLLKMDQPSNEVTDAVQELLTQHELPF